MRRVVVTLLGLVLSTLVGSTSAAAEESSNVWVRLVSQPVGAQGGEQVNHQIQVGTSGMPDKSAVQLFFSSTVPLEQMTVTAANGVCSTPSPTSVQCTVEVPVGQDGATVTVTGAVGPAAVGTVVQNIATVVAGAGDSNTADNGSANGYLLTRESTAPPTQVTDQVAVAGLADSMPLPPVASTGSATDWMSGALKIGAILATVVLGVWLVVHKPTRGRHRRRPLVLVWLGHQQSGLRLRLGVAGTWLRQRTTQWQA